MANFISATNFGLLAALSLLTCCASSPASFDTHMKDGAVELSNVPGQVAQPRVVKLERQSVILPKTAVRAGKRKNFYSAKIAVGKPAQEFYVTFDLGGGTVVLPSKECKDPACLERRLYNKWTSESAEDIQANGQLVQKKVKKTSFLRRDHGTLDLHSIDVGSGKVKGTFVRDQVCLYGADDDPLDDDAKRDLRCFPLAMLMASKMSDMPFTLEPYDGTVGLGLNSMSVSPEFNFLTSFLKGYGDSQGFSNSFGLHIGSDGSGGEITFGGYDAKRLTQPLMWAPIADPQEGRWQVAISAIRVGNNTFEACRDRACRAAIDYSSSLLGVPTNLAKSLESVLSKTSLPSGFGDGCQHIAIPDIHLELTNDITLTLPAEDFVSDMGKPVSLRPSCNPLLTHHDADEAAGQDVFILGEATLRRYYTFFNADTQSVGFSLAAGAPEKKGPRRAALDGENPVILLVQVKLVKKKTVSSLGM